MLRITHALLLVAVLCVVAPGVHAAELSCTTDAVVDDAKVLGQQPLQNMASVLNRLSGLGATVYVHSITLESFGAFGFDSVESYRNALIQKCQNWGRIVVQEGRSVPVIKKDVVAVLLVPKKGFVLALGSQWTPKLSGKDQSIRESVILPKFKDKLFLVGVVDGLTSVADAIEGVKPAKATGVGTEQSKGSSGWIWIVLVVVVAVIGVVFMHRTRTNREYVKGLQQQVSVAKSSCSTLVLQVTDGGMVEVLKVAVDQALLSLEDGDAARLLQRFNAWVAQVNSLRDTYYAAVSANDPTRSGLSADVYASMFRFYGSLEHELQEAKYARARIESDAQRAQSLAEGVPGALEDARNQVNAVGELDARAHIDGLVAANKFDVAALFRRLDVVEFECAKEKPGVRLREIASVIADVAAMEEEIRTLRQRRKELLRTPDVLTDEISKTEGRIRSQYGSELESRHFLLCLTDARSLCEKARAQFKDEDFTDGAETLARARRELEKAEVYVRSLDQREAERRAAEERRQADEQRREQQRLAEERRAQDELDRKHRQARLLEEQEAAAACPMTHGHGDTTSARELATQVVVLAEMLKVQKEPGVAESQKSDAVEVLEDPGLGGETSLE